MARTTIETVPAPLQGVSQQDPLVRSKTQVTEQVNMSSSLLEGLKTRAGSYYKNWIADERDVEHVHKFVSNGEEYVAFINDDALAVYDMNGTKKGVKGYGDASATYGFTDPDLSASIGANYSDYMAYTAANQLPGRRNQILVKTVGDTTFICNTTKKTAMDLTSGGREAPGEHTYIYAKSARFGSKIRVMSGAGSTLANFTVQSYYTGSDVSLRTAPTAKTVLYEIGRLLQIAGATCTLYGDRVLKVHDRLYTVEDGNSGNDIVGFTASVKTYDDLPFVCQSGVTVGVMGDREADKPYFMVSENDYEYINSSPPAITYASPVDGTAQSYTPDNYIDIKGTRWRETASIGAKLNTIPEYDYVYNSYDVTTMPLTMVQDESTGIFMVGYGDWEKRVAGTEETNEIPKFIGHPIYDIEVYQDRLIFISNNYVCASRTGEYFSFFKDTVIKANPANPVFKSTSAVLTNRSAGELYRAVTVAGELLLFDFTSQYKIPGQTAFTADSPLIKVAENTTDPASPHVTTRRGVIIFDEQGGITNVSELLVISDARDVIKEPLTDHVPKYIEGKVKYALHHEPTETTFLMTEGDTDYILYVNSRYTKSDGTIAQNAWYKMYFGSEGKFIPIGMWESDGNLFLCVDAEVYLSGATQINRFFMYMPIGYNKNINEQYVPYAPFLDCMQVSTVFLYGGQSTVSTSIGYTDVVCILGNNSDSPGMIVETIDNGYLRIPDEYGVEPGTNVIIGRPTQGYTELSKLYIRQTDGTPRTSARTMLKRLWLNLKDSQRIRVEVNHPKINKTYYKEWDADESVYFGSYGESVIASPVVDIGLAGDNNNTVIKLISDSHKSFAVTGFKYQASYGKRKRTSQPT